MPAASVFAGVAHKKIVTCDVSSQVTRDRKESLRRFNVLPANAKNASETGAAPLGRHAQQNRREMRCSPPGCVYFSPCLSGSPRVLSKRVTLELIENEIGGIASEFFQSEFIEELVRVKPG